jgi:hypothetical protein
MLAFERTALVALSLFVAATVIGCKKPDDTTKAATSAAPESPPTPQQPAPATPPPNDPTAALETCKKNFATSCAVPCEKRVMATEKDPKKQKTELNQCMVTCLTDAEKACGHH